LAKQNTANPIINPHAPNNNPQPKKLISLLYPAKTYFSRNFCPAPPAVANGGGQRRDRIGDQPGPVPAPGPPRHRAAVAAAVGQPACASVGTADGQSGRG